ncbi:MAG: DUF547 domain-containing protein [Pseudomonadota bacterium]
MLTRREMVLRAGALATFGGASTGRAARGAPASALIDGPWRETGAETGPEPAAWADLLSRRLRLGDDGIARFDYAAARADLPALQATLELLEGTDPRRLSAPAQMAFWINLYNALTVKLVVEAWPVGSIREVMGGLFNLGPWDENLVQVLGRPLSLDDIEHGILRPVFRDARIHYGVNCASIGCPNLAAEPYRADRLEAMLEAGARAFVNHPRGALASEGRLTVSSIYAWFEEDFGGTDAGVIAHLARYADAPLAGNLAGRTRVDRHAYDWAVNAV